MRSKKWQFDRMRWLGMCAPLGLTVGLLAVGLSACAQQAKTGPDAKSAAQESTQGKDMSADAEALYAQAMTLVQTDPAQAGLMLEGAALQGHGDAAYQLGLMQSDANRRIEWYSMAASVGQMDAEYALGKAYLNGIGTAKEPAWGLSWFERAARAGHAPAQYALGVALSTGLTGPAMYEEALVWLLIAKKNGFADADLLIGFLDARLSSSVLTSVQKRADAWTNEPAGDAEGRATTRFAQHALGRLGFDAGLADGIQGGRTDTAVSAFRQSQGLEPGGLDGRTLDALRERLAVLNR